MVQHWLPILLEDRVELVDERRRPTWIDGVARTILQNADSIKLTAYALLLLTPGVLFASLYVRAEEERRRADQETVRATLAAHRAEIMSEHTLETVEWVFNETAKVEFDDSTVANRPLIEGLMRRLAAAGYTGEVLLEGHIGDFLFIERADGASELANNVNVKHLRPGDELRTYTEQYSLALGDRQANNMKDLVAELHLPFRVRTVSYGEESPLVPYPGSTDDADEWNRVAAENHRVTMKLLRARRRP